MPAEERILLAQTINEADLMWTADPYLSSSEELNFAQTGSETESVSSVHSHSHNHVNKKPFADGTPDFRNALADAQKYLNTDLKDINIDDLPESWTWENVNGYDFASRHIDQGHCGSCYLLATNAMLESRIKIWYGKDMPLSVQQRLDCNFINEGCHGGWGYFDGLFLEQYGAVSEQCAAYVASTSPEGCGKHASCPKIAGVKDTYYVGNRHYGGMSEQDMIKEVRARGPILIDFNAGREFQAYKGGVLSEDTPVSLAFAHSPSALSQIYSDSYCDGHSYQAECMSR